MMTIYKILIQFPTYALPRSCEHLQSSKSEADVSKPERLERTFFLSNAADLANITRVAESAGWQVTSSTIDHVMTPAEIVDEIDQEIDMRLREMHQNGSEQ